MTIGSLCSGIGGLELGLELCGLGPVVWYCERDPYARGVLAHHWPQATSYTDIRRLDAACPVDILCAGFPCQPHSVAGKRQGKADPRWLWPAVAQVVARLKPRAVFLENVPGLRTSGLRDVLADLADLGLDAEWDCFLASDVGASHRRRRLFIVAHAEGARLERLGERMPRPGSDGGALADADGDPLRVAKQRVPARRPDRVRDQGQAEPRYAGVAMADPHGGRQQVVGGAQPGRLESAPGYVAHRPRRDWGEHRFPPGPQGIGAWDGPEPAVRRGSHGLSHRVDRLRCLGNAVVPQQAALAWRTLIERAAP